MMRIQKKNKNDRGSVLLEFAIVFPIFTLLFMSLVDIVSLAQTKHSVQNALRESIIYTSRIPALETGVFLDLIKNCPTSNPPTYCDAQNLTKNIIDSLRTSQRLPIYGYEDSLRSPIITTTYNASGIGNNIKIKIVVTYKAFFPLYEGAQIEVEQIGPYLL
jgi:hypothetical protein